jgi:putative phosphoribosyl transferase
MFAQATYLNRTAAGAQLAELLGARPWSPTTLVVALPRGGVPVAAAIAGALGLELDVLIVRKLGLPEQPEVALGAIASGDVTILNDWILAGLPNPQQVVERIVARERRELHRREEAYRPGRPALDVGGREVIVVDDGLATGATMTAALESLRKRGASRCVVAVPVGSRDALDSIGGLADEVVCPLVPDDFTAVGCHYQDFSETSDDEVRELLGCNAPLS